MRRSVIALIARHTGTFAANLIGTLVLVRALGPEVWGLYAASYVALTIGQQIVERGPAAYIVRLGNQRPALATYLIDGVFALLVAVLMLSAGLVVGDNLHSVFVTTLFASNAAAVLLYALRALRLGELEGAMQYSRVAIVELVDAVTFNSIAISGVLIGTPYPVLVVAIVARAALSTAAMMLLGSPSRSGQRADATSFVRFVIPYTVWNGLSWLNVAAAPVLVLPVAGAASFAVLQLAYSLIVYPQTLASIFLRVEFPSYVSLSTLRDELIKRVRLGASSALMFGGMGVLVLAISSLMWVTPIFGADWVRVSDVMLVVAAPYVATTSIAFVVNALNASGYSGIVAAIGAGYTAVYWAAAAILVPLLGPLAIPLAYAVALSVQALYLSQFRRMLGVIDVRYPLGVLAAMSLLLVAVVTGSDRVLASTLGCLATIVIGLPLAIGWFARWRNGFRFHGDDHEVR